MSTPLEYCRRMYKEHSCSLRCAVRRVYRCRLAHAGIIKKAHARTLVRSRSRAHACPGEWTRSAHMSALRRTYIHAHTRMIRSHTCTHCLSLLQLWADLRAELLQLIQAHGSPDARLTHILLPPTRSADADRCRAWPDDVGLVAACAVRTMIDHAASERRST